eukprot:TRINITY_DN14150_c0_g2_i7.p1 TRINITY_DN14150_c0_g2~~TRINITY_DN14150_c0_g2_i7.p1  ORF type:complete len:1349 (-),score=124.19 TRINITY_DN14150_c0_g2_i7:348-4394(-)
MARVMGVVLCFSAVIAFEDKTSTIHCFPPDERIKRDSALATLFHDIGGDPAISLEIQDWMTHRLNSRVAEILLREKLGFDVTVRRFVGEEQSSRAAYVRLNERRVDLNVEVWPYHYQELRKELLDGGKFDLGHLTGFTAITGWFIPMGSLASVPAVNVTLHSGEGQVGPRVEISTLKLMRSLPHAAQTLLTKARNLEINSICGKDAVKVGTTDDAYNCTDGSWMRNGSTCAPRGAPLDGRLPCPALMATDPDYDRGQIEKMISDLELDLQIVYEPALNEKTRGRNWTSPILIHDYAPSPLVTAPGADFLQVKVANGMPVDFPAQNPELVISHVYLRSRSYQTFPAHYLVKQFNVTNKDIERMQVLMAAVRSDQSLLERYDGDEYFAAACEWLRSSPDAWKQWLQPEFSRTGHIAFVLLIVMIVIIIYTLDASYRYYWEKSSFMDAARWVSSCFRRKAARCDNPPNPCSLEGIAASADLIASRTPVVTFAQSTFSCSISSGEAVIHLLRFGDASGAAIAEVTTVDGAYAQFGRHYMQTCGDGPGSSVPLPQPYSILRPSSGDTSKHPARTAEVHFAQGQRSGFVKITIADTSQGLAVREFSIKLIGARNVADNSVIACAPVAASVVRIHDSMRFPNGYRLKYPHPPFGQQHRSVDDILRSVGNNLISPQMSFRAFLGEGKISLRRLLLDRFQLARHFVIALSKFEAHSILWWHIQGLVNAITNFTDSLLFAYLLDKVLGTNGHPNWGYALAFAKMATFWLKYRAFHFITPYFTMMLNFKNMLMRKLLSLSREQLQSQPHLESRYLHAISTSSETAWIPIFTAYHSLYFAAYKNLSSVAYILFTVATSQSGDNNKSITIISTVLLLLAVLVIKASIHLFRVKRQMDYGASYDCTKQAAASYTYHICRDWRLIRLYGLQSAVERKVAQLQTTFNDHDIFGWLHFERTKMIAGTAQEFIICVMWARAYELTKPEAFSGKAFLSTGDFLTILSNVSLFAGSIDSLVSVFCGYDGLLRNSFKVEEIADLLNVGLDSNVSQELRCVSTEGAQDEALVKFSAALSEPAAACRICFMVKDLTFHHTLAAGKGMSSCIFDALKVAGAIDGRYLPTGLVGLRLSEDARHNASSVFTSQADVTLLDLLARAWRPTSGVCTVAPTVKVMPVIAAGLGAVVEGTLLENLHLATQHEGEVRISEEQLWHLCSFVGLSEVLLGETFVEGWSKLHVSSLPERLSGSDLFKLMLARALVQRPQVLLVGGAVSLSDQLALAPVIYAFLDGSLDELVYGVRPTHFCKGERAVLWSAADEVLSSKLRKTDHVLTLQSPQLASLEKAEEFLSNTTPSDEVDEVSKFVAYL